MPTDERASADSSARRSVVVTVAGQRYTLRSDADATYLRTLAGHVEKRMDEVRRAAQAAPTDKVAVLAAMRIADELFQERGKRREMKQRVRDRAQTVLAMIEREERSVTADA